MKKAILYPLLALTALTLTGCPGEIERPPADCPYRNQPREPNYMTVTVKSDRYTQPNFWGGSQYQFSAVADTSLYIFKALRDMEDLDSMINEDDVVRLKAEHTMYMLDEKGDNEFFIKLEDIDTVNGIKVN